MLNKDGRVLAFAGYGDNDARMIGAIASGIWTSYSNYGKILLPNNSMKHIYVECSNGSAIVTAIADTLLCLYARDSNIKVNPGLMKLKMDVLVEHLDKQLSDLTGI